MKTMYMQKALSAVGAIIAATAISACGTHTINGMAQASSGDGVIETHAATPSATPRIDPRVASKLAESDTNDGGSPDAVFRDTVTRAVAFWNAHGVDVPTQNVKSNDVLSCGDKSDHTTADDTAALTCDWYVVNGADEDNVIIYAPSALSKSWSMTEGRTAVAIIAAHEVGHVAAHEASIDAMERIGNERAAQCLAGAFMRTTGVSESTAKSALPSTYGVTADRMSATATTLSAAFMDGFRSTDPLHTCAAH